MLDDAGVDGVVDVWMPPIVTGMNVVVQVRKRYHGHAQQVASALWGSAAGQWFFKNVTVVEEDVDLRDRETAQRFGFDARSGKVDDRPQAARIRQGSIRIMCGRSVTN